MLGLLEEASQEMTYGRSLRQSRAAAGQYHLHLWAPGSAVLQEGQDARGTTLLPAKQLLHEQPLSAGDFDRCLLVEVLR
jgi:hypothetical protein